MLGPCCSAAGLCEGTVTSTACHATCCHDDDVTAGNASQVELAGPETSQPANMQQLLTEATLDIGQ